MNIMSEARTLPYDEAVFHEIAEEFGTPVYVYDEAGIRANAQEVNKAFGWSPGYINHFAVKAAPFPAVLRAVQAEGMGFDCSSKTELLMVRDQVGGDSPVFYTSNNTPDEHYQVGDSMGALINADKLPDVADIGCALGGLPTRMAIRYNPGGLKAGNDIIGDPRYAKFGDTEEHVLEALQQMREGGVQETGLHTMVVSNQKDPQQFKDTARLLRELAEKAYDQLDIAVSFINIGGGIGVQYNPGNPEDIPTDVPAIGQAVESELGGLGVPIVSENGRYITGPHGYFLTRVQRGIAESYQRFLRMDTSINNMARLATVTAAYHEIHILGREGDERGAMTVTGSMCANTDKYFKDRMLPLTARPGDLMVIHDAGAHMQSNSHNYNGWPRAAGVIIRLNGDVELAVHGETEEDILRRTDGL